MPLSNAERQARYRDSQRRKLEIAQTSMAPGTKTLSQLLVEFFEEDPTRQEEWGFGEWLKGSALADRVFFEAGKKKRSTPDDVVTPARHLLRAFEYEPGNAAAAIRSLLKPLC